MSPNIVATAWSILTEIINIWVLIAFALSALVWYWWKRPGPKYPPGPRGVPLLGVLPFMGKLPFQTFLKWSKTYGPVMSVRFGPKPVITLNDYDSIVQGFKVQEEDFSGRPWIHLIANIWERYGVVSKDYGEEFKIQKLFLSSQVKQFVDEKRGEEVILEEIEYFHEELKSLADEPVHIENRLISAIINVLSAVIFGQRFDYKDPEFSSLVDTFVRGASPPNPTSQVLVFLIPSLRFIPPFRGAVQYYNKVEYERADILRNLIAEQKKSLDENNLHGLVDAFHAEMHKGTNTFTEDKQMLALVRDVYQAGTLSIQMQILWLIAILTTHPEHYERIKEEVDSIEDSRIRLNHQSSTPFAKAFILEAMRMTSIAPLGITRISANDAELCGYRIPKGTEMMSNLWAANNDPTTWKDAEVFDPFRFLDEDGRYAPSPKVINFSVGVRKCPGEVLTKHVAYLMLCNLVKEFEISIVADSMPNFTNGNLSGFFSPAPYKVMLNKR